MENRIQGARLSMEKQKEMKLKTRNTLCKGRQHSNFDITLAQGEDKKKLSLEVA